MGIPERKPYVGFFSGVFPTHCLSKQENPWGPDMISTSRLWMAQKSQSLNFRFTRSFQTIVIYHSNGPSKTRNSGSEFSQTNFKENNRSQGGRFGFAYLGRSSHVRQVGCNRGAKGTITPGAPVITMVHPSSPAVVDLPDLG